MDLLNRRIFLASPGLFLQELKLVYIILIVVGISKNILSISRIIMDTVLYKIVSDFGALDRSVGPPGLGVRAHVLDDDALSDGQI